MSSSPSMIVPVVGSSRPATIRRVVVLPQPDGPEQREERALGDGEVEVVDGGERAEALGDRRQLQVGAHQAPMTFAKSLSYCWRVFSSSSMKPNALARNSSSGKISGLSTSDGSIFSIASWAPATGQM